MMKFQKIIKWFLCAVLIISGTVAGTSAVNPTVAQAKKSTRVVKVTYKKVTKRAYKIKKGKKVYTTSKLKKVAHFSKRARHTTVYRYKQGKVTRANHKKAIYYYVKSNNGQVKGWIWRGNLKAKKTSAKKTTTKKTEQSATPTADAVETPAKVETNKTVTKPVMPANSQSSSSTGTPTTPTTPTTSTTPTTPTNPQQPTTPTTVPDDKQEVVKTTIYGPLSEGNKIIATGDIPYTKGATGYSVLKTLCDNNGISIVGTDYVSSIGGKKAGTGGVGGGWLYAVNDKFFDFAATDCQLKPGDVVNWMWTQTQGDRGYDF